MLLAGRYRLGEAIGRGGMGRVWRAQDELLNRTVAVKELTAGLYATEAEREVLHRRTRTEARAAARISHPNVVTVHDVLEHDGRPWIVMQYVDGRSLSDAVKDSGPVDAREAARIGAAVLGALRAAHAAGVLHRDVKPANVMLSHDGQVLLTDFGIAAVEGDASVTRTGELIGSVEYLAPERVRGRAPGPASDLWSLGATLYTAVQGISPYHRESALVTLQAVIVDEAPYPAAAGELGPVIVAMLRKEPDERPGAAECARLLTDVAEGRQADTTALPATGPAAQADSYGTPPGTGAAGTAAFPQPPYGHPSSSRDAHGQDGHQQDPYQRDPHRTQGPADGRQAATHAQQGFPQQAFPHEAFPQQTHARQAGTHAHGQAGPARQGQTRGGLPYQNTSWQQGPSGPTGPYGQPGPYVGTGAHGGPRDGAPARGPEHGRDGGRKGSRGRAVVLALVAAVVIGGGIGYGVTNFGDASDGTNPSGTGAGADASGRGTSGGSDTQADGSGSGSGDTQSGARGVPAGWRRVEAPEGFGLWLPKGYVRTRGTSTTTFDYSPDNDQHVIRISVDPQPDFPTPLQHLENLEGAGGKVGGLPDYRRITLGSDTYRDQKLAARWEFTWTQSASQGPAGPRTAADVMYIDADTGTEYAIYMSTPTAEWDDSAFSTALRGWQPPADPDQ
jgi:serine/threonine protein kinase